MKHVQPWFVGATLRAIAQHVQRTAQIFTALDVATWDESLKGQPGKARMALQRMENHKLVEPCELPITRTVAKLEPRWKLTPKGLGTCRAILQAKPGAALPDASALSSRLWALLRSRKTLTSEEAASTLIDAGSRDFAKAQYQISGYLRAWEQLVPDVVKVSARRVEGCKRYVMVKDGGVRPPPTKASAIPPMPAPSAHPAPSRANPAKQEARA